MVPISLQFSKLLQCYLDPFCVCTTTLSNPQVLLPSLLIRPVRKGFLKSPFCLHPACSSGFWAAFKSRLENTRGKIIRRGRTPGSFRERNYYIYICTQMYKCNLLVPCFLSPWPTWISAAFVVDNSKMRRTSTSRMHVFFYFLLQGLCGPQPVQLLMPSGATVNPQPDVIWWVNNTNKLNPTVH